MPKKRVILVGDRKKERVRRAVKELTDWLKGKTRLIAVDLTNRLDLSKVKADLVVVLGGDGAILSTARRLGRNQIPVVGVNFGKFGFLANYSIEELKESLNHISVRKYQGAPRMMLKCEVVRRNKKPVRTCPNGSVRRADTRPGGGKVFLALNDVVITRGAMSRMLYLKLSINRRELTTFGADGLIVSTPVGSTAHSLAAGGPLLHPSLKALIITPICAHTLSMRPLVIPPTDSISVELVGKPPVCPDGRRDTGRQEVVLTIDGQIFMNFKPQYQVNISMTKHSFRLVESLHRTFYETLGEKMFWGGQPHHQE